MIHTTQKFIWGQRVGPFPGKERTAMTHRITAGSILCLLALAGCATAVDPTPNTASTSGGELATGNEEVPRLPDLPNPCGKSETAVLVAEGQCLRVTGYHWSPHHGRWWGGCATHKWNGLCDQDLTICVGEGSTVDELGDECTPCDPSEVGDWGSR